MRESNVADTGVSLLGVTLSTNVSRDHKNKYFASLRLFFKTTHGTELNVNVKIGSNG